MQPIPIYDKPTLESEIATLTNFAGTTDMCLYENNSGNTYGIAIFLLLPPPPSTSSFLKLSYVPNSLKFWKYFLGSFTLTRHFAIFKGWSGLCFSEVVRCSV